MRKILSIVTTLVFFGFTTAIAEMGVGLTGNFASVETSGNQTLRDGGATTAATHDNDVTVPEIFVEIIGDRGAVGLAYIPAQELGSKSRSDSNATGDTGTDKAAAEVSGHVMLYADVNIAEYANQTFYLKGGIASAELTTQEDLNSGSTYSDETVLGATVGLGMKGDVGSNLYYKLDVTYTDYDDYRDTNSVGNTVTAETEITSGKISVGYKF